MFDTTSTRWSLRRKKIRSLSSGSNKIVVTVPYFQLESTFFSVQTIFYNTYWLLDSSGSSIVGCSTDGSNHKGVLIISGVVGLVVGYHNEVIRDQKTQN